MTISTGLVILIIVLLAWKMKGAQLPHVFLGMVLMAASAEGSLTYTIGVEGLELMNTVINAIAGGLGNGNIV